MGLLFLLLLSLRAAAYSDELDNRRRDVGIVGSTFLPADDPKRVGDTDRERVSRSPRLGGGDTPSLTLEEARNFDDSGFLGECGVLVLEDRFGEMDCLTVVVLGPEGAED